MRGLANRSIALGLLLLATSLAVAREPAADRDTSSTIPATTSGEPLDLGTTEKETIRLLLLDVVVLDKQGRSVADLEADDFDVIAAGEYVEVDTLDLNCGEPKDPTRLTDSATPPPETDSPNRIVLALDYLHMHQIQVVDVFERARKMVREVGIEGAEVMVAALNGGLRVEQRFTRDTDELLSSLKRMEYDITLWNGRYDHLNETGFVAGMTALLDALGTLPGPKAIVLFSAMNDVPLDLEFQKLAAVASSSRCLIYPVDVRGMHGGVGGVVADVAPG